MSNDRQEPSAGENVDATRPLPRADRSGPPDADATRPIPGDAERPAPANPTAPLPPTPPAWSGRAGVPPPRPPDQSTDWYTEEQADRRWWMPILLGILALALLALIGLGVWLVLRAADEGPAPSPTPSPRPTTAPATSAAPTSAAPSTAPPTTPPATTAAAEVPMPPLVGLPEAAARQILDRLDVDYRVRTRTSEQPAGTVLETDPGAGEPIREGDRVTVVVAGAAAPTSSAGTPTPGPSATSTP
ncbi:PASTA domain-containing protein [Micromonospora sp. R77]|uniref:PASTA domain-containing protein n=1 Tax=Micromonospora sp. R77 TaxID=2925836 RepID=UPI001F6008DB|nr:PASTA domain-containing protein [Micromonospora sp. R77]MCI4063490.1 PASTA domain-containing protein [Micromonospora sp. R77]